VEVECWRGSFGGVHSTAFNCDSDIGLGVKCPAAVHLGRTPSSDFSSKPWIPIRMSTLHTYYETT
jgi:hypothetical protein